MQPCLLCVSKESCCTIEITHTATSRADGCSCCHKINTVCSDTPSLQDPSIFMWSDSQIMLHWIKITKELPTFVRNCVAEIQTNILNADWRYCPTFANPDLLSRGTTAQVFLSSKLWQHGPDWLVYTVIMAIQ